VGDASNNAAPTPNNDSITVYQGVALTFDPRVNDLDPDYDPLTITGKTNGTHGTVTYTSTSLTYTPTGTYHGSDSFTYTVSDGNSHTTNATVSVTVVNRPPTPGNDTIASLNGAAVTFDPRGNDGDPESDTLTITGKTNGAHGTVTYTSTSLTYTPTAGYYGTDTFTYTVSDGQGNTATATVTATMTGTPTAVNDSWDLIVTYVGTPIDPTGDFNPVTNDSDPDGDALSISGVGTPTHGAVAITGAQTVHYHYGTALSHDQTRTDSFTYTITDGHGNTSTATVTVNITVVDGT
jgi:hypothetical protein